MGGELVTGGPSPLASVVGDSEAKWAPARVYLQTPLALQVVVGDYRRCNLSKSSKSSLPL